MKAAQMQCPKCNKQATKAKVLETRTVDGTLYRRRCCGACFKTFVTIETAPEGLRLPRAEKGPEARLKPGQGEFNTQHLIDVWR